MQATNKPTTSQTTPTQPSITKRSWKRPQLTFVPLNATANDAGSGGDLNGRDTTG